MNNNKGFIATSLIYSFFLIFITLFLTIIADYLQNKVLLNTIENGIKEDINYGLKCDDFNYDSNDPNKSDKLVFQGNNLNILNPNIKTDGSVLYIITDKDCPNTITIQDISNVNQNFSINLDGKTLTKEPSDSEYYTITGVK